MEVCDVAKAARAILLKAMGEGKDSTSTYVKPSSTMNFEKTKDNLASVLTNLPEMKPIKQLLSRSDLSQRYIDYSVDCCTYLVMYGTAPNPNLLPDTNPDELWRYAAAMTTVSEWRECVVPYLRNVIDTIVDDASDEIKNNDNESKEINSKTDIEAVSISFRSSSLGDVADSQLENDINESNVCDIEFSLAFGGKILLHNTRLRLGKGRRYGLMGKNGAGKTTL